MSIVKSIKKNKYFVFTIVSILCVVGWFLNFRIWHITGLYPLFFIFYFLVNSIWLGKILAKLLNLEKELRLLFGLFLLLFLIAFGMAVPIFFYKITPNYLFGLLLFLTILISSLNQLKHFSDEPDNEFKILEENQGIKIPKICYLLFIICYLSALALLFYSRTGSFILSPWEAIRAYYVYLWFGVALIAAVFIFSKEKIGRILLVIVFASLLLHAYLPIVYQAGFGGDKWRHLGAERWLMEGKIYSPALFGEPLKWKQAGPIKIPEIFIVGNKNSYVNMWGLTITLSWLLGVDVFWVDLLLGYALFSIFFPLLLFKFAQFFVKNKRFCLLLSFLPLLFFPFQAHGSITVPVSFGFLWFFFSLFFIFRLFIQSKGRAIILVAIICVFLSYFNYILYAILLLEITIFGLIFKKIRQTRKTPRLIFAILAVFCFLIFLAVIPVFDTFNDYSTVSADIGLNWQTFENTFVNFGKRLLVSWPIFSHPAFMEQDNVLFMQPQESLSRASFLHIIPWPFLLAPLVLLICLLSIRQIKKSDHPIIGWLCFAFVVVLILNQFIASYFMTGNHLFSKRLTVVIAFLIMPLVAGGLYQFINWKFGGDTAKIIFVSLILAAVSTAVYVSGPKMQTVTADEMKAARYIWQNLKNTSGPYCVLANTWPLLAIEAESGRQIIAGGFPLYFEYAQKERVQIFDNMNKTPSLKDMRKALTITGAEECYFMTEEKWLYSLQKNQSLSQLNKILGSAQKFGDVYLWRFEDVNK